MKRFCNTVKGLTEEQEKEFARDSKEFVKKETEKFLKQNEEPQDSEVDGWVIMPLDLFFNNFLFPIPDIKRPWEDLDDLDWDFD